MGYVRTYGPTRAALRDLTASMHKDAEAVHWSSSGFGGSSDYRRFLDAMRSAHRVLGMPAARCRSDASGAAREQGLIMCLSADLGLPSTGADRGLHSGMRRDFAWGVAYALSGSALGAASILASGTLRPRWPQRYLTAQRHFARSGGARRFFDALNAAAPDIDEALEGAKAVFQIIASAPRGMRAEP